ncbi:MAG: alpha/beta fold hydrolase [Pseudomonadota bacterium]
MAADDTSGGVLGEGAARMAITLHRRADDAPRALVLHGRNGAADSDHIRPITAALHAQGYTVTVPELRFSDANASAGSGCNFTFSAHVADAARALDWLAELSPGGARPILIAGHSVGAYAALRLAADRGASAVSAVLALSPASGGGMLIEARRAMGAAALQALAAEVEGALQDYPRHDVLPDAARITQPVALVVGAEDGLTRPADVARLAAALPRVVGHEVLEGLHHCPTGALWEAALDRQITALGQALQ